MRLSKTSYVYLLYVHTIARAHGYPRQFRRAFRTKFRPFPNKGRPPAATCHKKIKSEILIFIFAAPSISPDLCLHRLGIMDFPPPGGDDEGMTSVPFSGGGPESPTPLDANPASMSPADVRFGGGGTGDGQCGKPFAEQGPETGSAFPSPNPPGGAKPFHTPPL